ncbi:MAG: hypothetical protein CMJ19_21690 [Phycisphaeraceae bacterium]|nr:hypothetical protein [Phycisphaeraceae bacterium]
MFCFYQEHEGHEDFKAGQDSFNRRDAEDAEFRREEILFDHQYNTKAVTLLSHGLPFVLISLI